MRYSRRARELYAKCTEFQSQIVTGSVINCHCLLLLLSIDLPDKPFVLVVACVRVTPLLFFLSL